MTVAAVMSMAPWGKGYYKGPGRRKLYGHAFPNMNPFDFIPGTEATPEEISNWIRAKEAWSLYDFDDLALGGY